MTSQPHGQCQPRTPRLRRRPCGTTPHSKRPKWQLLKKHTLSSFFDHVETTLHRPVTKLPAEAQPRLVLLVSHGAQFRVHLPAQVYQQRPKPPVLAYDFPCPLEVPQVAALLNGPPDFPLLQQHLYARRLGLINGLGNLAHRGEGQLEARRVLVFLTIIALQAPKGRLLHIPAQSLVYLALALILFQKERKLRQGHDNETATGEQADAAVGAVDDACDFAVLAD